MKRHTKRKLRRDRTLEVILFWSVMSLAFVAVPVFMSGVIEVGTVMAGDP